MRRLKSGILGNNCIYVTYCIVYILEVESFQDLLDVSNVWTLERSKRVQLVYALQSKFYDKASTEFLNISDSYAEVKIQLYVVLKRKKYCFPYYLQQKPPVFNFKLLLITDKSLNGLAPVYIIELLHHYTPCRSLRSSDSNLVVVPKTTTVTYGDRSFVVVAPKL